MEPNKQESELQAKDMTPSLVARLRKGGTGAGALLDELYRDKLVRFCWGYLGNMEEAEDAVQDICYRVLAATSVPDAFRPWLYKTARNQCFNLLRHRARHREGQELPAASEVHEVLTGHLTRLVRNEQRSRLSELVRSLPEAQREVLRLRYVEDLPRPEIAEVLDIPESVVKSRLFEGLKQLRKKASLLENL
ncbi:MAG: RNA polymerase sigma factor [Phycisphaerae bacterium]